MSKVYTKIELENEITKAQTSALTEEKQYAKDNYKYFYDKIHNESKELPYPYIKKFTVASSAGVDLQTLQYMKECNMPHWEEIDRLAKYYNDLSLYKGHIFLSNNEHYFFTENKELKTHPMDKKGNVHLVNVDDKKYNEYRSAWNFPKDNDKVVYSRNVTIKNKEAVNIDVKLDKSSELFSNITDSYLKNVLIRGKNSGELHSIIQTIQKKQDNIRLHPAKRSFILQGCAGSGKTMVLLHRLRYLLYNDDIKSYEYYFLVPSTVFKDFIQDIAKDFNISINNILSHKSYYQLLHGLKPEENDTNELVFPAQYLNRVYSKEFIQECYGELFIEMKTQLNLLIELSEETLSDLMDKYKNNLENTLKVTERNYVEFFKDCAKKILNHIPIESYETDCINSYIENYNELLSKAKSEYDKSSKANEEITISPDDERILSNAALKSLKNEIEKEEILVKKAFIFTVKSHKAKLEKLQETYNEIYQSVLSEIINEERVLREEQLKKSSLLFDDTTLDEAEEIFSLLSFKKDSFMSAYLNSKNELENIEETFYDKYNTEIDILNSLIKDSSVIDSNANEFISKLKPSCDYLIKMMQAGNELVAKLNISTQNRHERFGMFTVISEEQKQAYLNQTLFEICKRKIRNEFDIKLSKHYKHYWYLSLYFRYLTRDNLPNRKKYIYIDEAQDLSVSELELINKINSCAGDFDFVINDIYAPFINLFGDTSQTITEHGIKSWDQVDFISDIFTLDENFRNTNQIIRFCNEKLPFKMQEIGVDMDDVTVYPDIKTQIDSTIVGSELTYIVKDEFSYDNLCHYLRERHIKPTGGTIKIFTVKEVKGLEFKEVFVIDKGMTHNEKYIAYTRALVKLNVIKDMPFTLEKESYILEDEE